VIVKRGSATITIVWKIRSKILPEKEAVEHCDSKKRNQKIRYKSIFKKLVKLKLK